MVTAFRVAWQVFCCLKLSVCAPSKSYNGATKKNNKKEVKWRTLGHKNEERILEKQTQKYLLEIDSSKCNCDEL